MHPDRLNAVDPFQTLQAAYGALSGAQSFPANQQVLGAAVLFISYCSRLKLDARELLQKAERIKSDADTHYAANVRALNQYIDEELRKHG